jgi:nitroimidazol reductase NimA-like FMN-containing flavoprotein (pyridoxamine 5'-phosphate oxidase superfamily)
MTEMSKEEIARFVMQGTFTGKLATVKKDGSSHVVPIWFVLDNENSKRRRSRIGNIIFTTDSTSTAIAATITTDISTTSPTPKIIG